MENLDAIKALGVDDCVKWIQAEVKRAKEHYQWAKKRYGQFDCQEEKARLDTLVSVKISLEKYAKKLRHQAREACISEDL
jgi:hypothetical protein